jgi:exodeoxyribonuclease VII small subunit
MAKKVSFEENMKAIDEIIANLETGDLNLDDSIKEYEKAMKILKKSSEILEMTQGKLIKVTEDEGC